MQRIITNLFFTAILFTTVINIASAQCPCPKTSRGNYGLTSVKVFKFNDKDSMAVCGGMEQKNGRYEYSDFILYACGQPFSAGSWDGTQTCTITQKGDTLITEELYPIANGAGMSVNWTAFYITKFYFDKSALNKISYFRQDVKKYTDTEIQQALTAYKSIHLPVKNYDNYLLAVRRVFWAYVSGSKQAGLYMDELRKKYGKFDGAVAEDFDDIIMTYEHYKKDHQ